jgi:hypothetical protein
VRRRRPPLLESRWTAALAPLFAAVVVLAVGGCGPRGEVGPRQRLAADAIVVSLDGKTTFPLDGSESRDTSLGRPRAVDGPVSGTPILRFAAAPDHDLGQFSHAVISLIDLGPAPDRHAPGGALLGSPSSFWGDLIWYVETGRRGAAVFPGHPLDLARPASPGILLESDAHGRLDGVLFYPGTLYELVVTYVGTKGLASQLIRFTVVP